MRKSLLSFFFLTIAFGVILAACGGKGEKATGNNDANNGDSDGETHVLNLSYAAQEGEPMDKFARKWKELAEDASDGRLEFKLYPGEQLGSQGDVIEQAVKGDNIIVQTAFDFIMHQGVPESGILAAPYLTEDVDDLYYLLSTDWYDEIDQKLRDNGVRILAYPLLGVRQLMTKQEINSLDDMKGVKVRVPDTSLFIDTFEALGATPTPTPLNDLYPSLQQGIVDGAENPLSSLNATKVHEVTDHLTITNHIAMIVPFLGGTDFIESLPDDLVEILEETGKEAQEYQIPLVEEEHEKIMSEFKASGIQVNDNVDLKPFSDAVEEVYEKNGWLELRQEVNELLENK